MPRGTGGADTLYPAESHHNHGAGDLCHHNHGGSHHHNNHRRRWRDDHGGDYRPGGQPNHANTYGNYRAYYHYAVLVRDGEVAR